jgi:probable DNA repair protein
MIGQMKSQEIKPLQPRSASRRSIRLVPNRVHLDYWLGRAFDGRDEHAVVQAPPVYILSQWVKETAARAELLRGCAAPGSPGPLEVVYLWEAVIGDSIPGMQAEERHALACRARDADRLCRQWSLDPGERSASPDPRFSRWRGAVREAMRERDWHASEDWLHRLQTLLRNGDCPRSLLPREIVLTGFVELTELERSVLAALEAAGVRLSAPAQADPGNGVDAVRHHFDSFEEELSAAAAWAAAARDRGHGRVAVVVNELERCTGLVERIFAATLEPASVLMFETGRKAPFHLTVTEPLGNHPLVADALLLLDLAAAGPRAPREFQLLSRALLSASWSGGREERFARAMLERALRQSGRYRWSLAAVSDRASQGPGQAGLATLLAVVNGLAPPEPGLHPARQLLEWLIAWGWPGCETAGPRAVAACERLLGLLETLSRQRCDNVVECLARLRRLCAAEQMSPPGGPLSPILVMSPEHAYDQAFDAAWIANLTMQNWPARPVGNPLLAQAALRRVPRATEEGALAHARRITRWLRSCAAELRFSWCDRFDDLPVSASMLIADIPVKPARQVERAALWRAVEPAAASIRGYADHPWLSAMEQVRGRAMAASDERMLQASVDLLNHQSACPLAAYLRFRLGARMERVPAPFADSAYRGELVHVALERLYSGALHDHGRVLADEVPAAVDDALDRCHAGLRLLPAERVAMRDTLQELLRAWLDFENRGNGVRIEALEWRQCLAFEGFQFDVRVDRLERMADGRTFLLDYKTGRLANASAWGRERPGNLQLPLYAVLLEGKEGFTPGGLAMAGVRMNEMKYVGLSDADSCSAHGIPGAGKPFRNAAGRVADWRSAMEHWRNSLGGLLDEYRSGDCRHLRFDDQVLRYAGLEILLRGTEADRWFNERGSDGHG